MAKLSKAEAARINGRKGGRPRTRPATAVTSSGITGRSGAATPKPKRRRKGNNHVPLELTVDREIEIWRYRVQGLTQAEIAARVSVKYKQPFTRAGVAKALKRVLDQREAEFVEEKRHESVLQCDQLDELAFVAKNAFDKSQGRGRSAGDARFLKIRLQALSDKRRILGLDAPHKVEHFDRDRPFEDLDEAALQRDIEQSEERIRLAMARDGGNAAAAGAAGGTH